jgi:Ca2+-binding EF-hand superfamily protein
MVEKAFNMLDKDGSGVLSLSDIGKLLSFNNFD